MKLTRAIRLIFLGVVIIASLSGCVVAARILTTAEAISVIDRIIESVPREQSDPTVPREIPPAGTATGVQAPVSGTEGVGLWLNGSPGAERLQAVPEGTAVTLLCSTSGPSVTGPYGATTIWNYVRTPDGGTGYMSDAYLDTDTDEPAVPSC